MSNFRRTYQNFVVKPIKKLILLPKIIKRNNESLKYYFNEKFHLGYVIQLQKEELEKTRKEKEDLLEAHEKMTTGYQRTISEQKKALEILKAQVEETSAIALRSLATRVGIADPRNLREYGVERIVLDAFKALQSENEGLLQKIETLESARIPNLMKTLAEYSKDFRKIPIMITNKKGDEIYVSPSFARKAKRNPERIKKLVLKKRESMDYESFRVEYSEHRFIEGEEPFSVIILQNHPSRYEGKFRKASSRRYYQTLNSLGKISIKNSKHPSNNLY